MKFDISKKMFGKNFFWVCFPFIYGSVAAQLGNKCTVTSNNLPGICKLGSNCSVVEEEAKQGIDPTLCGFHELTKPIVCCPITDFGPDKKDGNEVVEPHNFLIPDGTVQRISDKKCEEYYPPIKSVAVPQVYNGKPAQPKEFPHMAVIGYGNSNDKQWACAGGLISSKFVLTAAHCINSRELGTAKYVRVGVLDVENSNTNDIDPQDFTVKNFTIHPKYRQPAKYHDIALIELNRPIKRNKYVNIACLDSEKSHTNANLLIAGWGQTEFAGSNSGHLLKAEVTVVDHQKCSSFYKEEPELLPNGIVDDWMICAGGKSDTCNGDSGGPLMKENTKYDDPVNQRVFNIIGVTSFGKACGIAGSPGIYTRVNNYLTWIENNVWPNES